VAPRVVLGLSAIGFDTSATLLVDGRPVFACQEERLVRQKRTRAFPMAAVRAALAHAKLGSRDVDAVAVSWNPGINLEAFNAAQSMRHRYLGEVLYSVPSHLLTLEREPRVAMTTQRFEFLDGHETTVHFVTHHATHAASFLMSPFEEAAVMTVDAFGENQCTTFSRGAGNRLEPVWSQEFPHSLGSFYSTFTEYCGFKPQSDEWELMGASAYGNPRRFLEPVRSLVNLLDDGFELDLKCFNHYQFHRPGYATPKLTERLGLPPNERDRPLDEAYYDLAAAAQRVAEEIYFHLLRRLHERTGLERVVLAGGVGLNSVANGKVTSETPFREVWIPPVPDDSGGSIGAALYVDCQVMGHPRSYEMRENYLGPGYDDDQIEAVLRRFNLRYERLDDPPEAAAERIAAGKILGWFQGRLEFGDRALGNRSILADPRDPEMKNRVNAIIKYRELFRPFAPAILAERVDDYFTGAAPTPFMEKVFPIRPDRHKQIPSVTHVDGTGRLQTVTREQNAAFHALIRAFEARTGVPVVMNTSFNLRGEAIVCAPEDAIRTFYTSGLDALVLGSFLLEK